MTAGERRPSRPLTTGEAAAYTGLSKSTVIRAVDRWLEGERGPAAIKGTRSFGVRAARRVDPVDVQRVKGQEDGIVDRGVTADEYAAWWANEQQRNAA